MEEFYKLFDDYVSNYDMSLDKIDYKYKHTYRVVGYAKVIAESESLNEDDTKIALTCALLHDIGRFEQIKSFDTYSDLDSFDHGDLGYEILKKYNYIEKYTKDKEIQEIILAAVKNHNKFKIDENLSKRQLYFSKLVRDADKLDIIKMCSNEITDNSNSINGKLLESFNNKELCDNEYIVNDCEYAFNYLTFIFDLNFKKSFEIVKKEKLIDKKIELLSKYVKDIDFNEIKNILYEYMDEKI